MSHNRNFGLTYDQRLLLDIYINFYNHTSRQIDALYDLQNEIRGNINQIVGLSEYHTRTYPSNQHQHSQRTQNANRRPRGRHGPENLNQPTNGSNNLRWFYINGTPRLIDITNLNQTNTVNEAANNIWRAFYENITVAPTQGQIENATRVVQFSEIENPTNNSCPITLDVFEDDDSVTQIIHCGHVFTPSGIESWLQSNVRCPVCRYDIREYVAPAIVHESTRESRRQETVPGNDEESYEAESQPIIQPASRRTTERPNNQTNPYSLRGNQTVGNSLSAITEELIQNILSPNRGSSIFDPSYNSLFYDSTNRHFVFEGLLRR
jgi:Ring finger domain